MNTTYRENGGLRARLGMFLIIPFLVLAGAGCDVLTGEYRYGDEFQLEKGKRAIVGNDALITFVRIVQDSRCPEPAVCVWAGDAEAQLELKRSGMAPKRFSLHTHAGFTQDTVIDGITVELLAVDPYPQEGEVIQPDDYRVTLRLTN